MALLAVASAHSHHEGEKAGWRVGHEARIAATELALAASGLQLIRQDYSTVPGGFHEALEASPFKVTRKVADGVVEVTCMALAGAAHAADAVAVTPRSHE